MEALGVDFKLLLAQIINFFLFFLIFKKFITRPFGQFLKEEKEKEKEKERLMSEIKEKEQKLAQLEKEILVRAQKAAQEIIKEAKDTAKLEAKKIYDQNIKEIDAMRKKMEQNLERQKEEIYHKAKTYVVTSASAMVKDILKEFLSEEDQPTLIDNILKKFKDNIYEN